MTTILTFNFLTMKTTFLASILFVATLISCTSEEPTSETLEGNLEITIDKNAELGNHELRLITEHGMSNPMTFQIDAFPEKKELEH